MQEQLKSNWWYLEMACVQDYELWDRKFMYQQIFRHAISAWNNNFLSSKSSTSISISILFVTNVGTFVFDNVWFRYGLHVGMVVQKVWICVCRKYKTGDNQNSISGNWVRRCFELVSFYFVPFFHDKFAIFFPNIISGKHHETIGPQIQTKCP